jgi:hypothetical protein
MCTPRQGTFKPGVSGASEETDMRIKIVAFGHFVDEVHFKVEGGTEGKELKVGDVVGYIDPQTKEMVEFPQIGQCVAMVVLVSLEDSELEQMYALPDDRLEDTSAAP